MGVLRAATVAVLAAGVAGAGWLYFSSLKEDYSHRKVERKRSSREESNEKEGSQTSEPLAKAVIQPLSSVQRIQSDAVVSNRVVVKQNDEDTHSHRGGAGGSEEAGGENQSERASVWEVETEDKYTTLGGKEVNEFEIQLILERDKHDLEYACRPVSEFWRNKYEKEARRMWDVFYKVNKTNFFKDRHYLDKEWDMLRTERGLNVLDAGCGVGNTALPLLSLNPDVRIWACDFSHNAVELLKNSEGFDAERCTAWAADLTNDSLSEKVGEGTMDVCMLIFVLSAINPEKFVPCLKNVAKTLRVGGQVLFRDYGLYDMAQLKMAQSRGHKISENFFVRKDGTRAYYFAEAELIQYFREAGFEVVQCEMHKRAVTNRKDNSVMHRRWVQGRFQKV